MPGVQLIILRNICMHVHTHSYTVLHTYHTHTHARACTHSTHKLLNIHLILWNGVLLSNVWAAVHTNTFILMKEKLEVIRTKIWTKFSLINYLKFRSNFLPTNFPTVFCWLHNNIDKMCFVNSIVCTTQWWWYNREWREVLRWVWKISWKVCHKTWGCRPGNSKVIGHVSIQ